MSDPKLESADGTRIFMYEEKETTALGQGSDFSQLIRAHFDKLVGKADGAWEDMPGCDLPVTVHRIPPSVERPHWVLYTTGMSRFAMTLPDDVQGVPTRAELVLVLPEDWFAPWTPETGLVHILSHEGFWPVRELLTFAKFPHTYQTWLALGHTVPNGAPAEPYAGTTMLDGAVFLPPMSVFPEPEECHIQLDDDNQLALLTPVFLYNHEMDYKLDRGLHALIDLFNRNGVDDVLREAREPMLPWPKAPSGSTESESPSPWWKFW